MTGGWREREFKRPFDAVFEQEMRFSQAAANVGAGPPEGRPHSVFVAHQRKIKEARYAHKVREAGWSGEHIWRRGWEEWQWNTDYLSPGLRERPGSLIHRDFRREFRIPLDMFDTLVEELRDARLPWARDEKTPRAGATPIPLALKVMSTLRVLAVGVPFSALQHHGLSESVVRVFFFNFVH